MVGSEHPTNFISQECVDSEKSQMPGTSAEFSARPQHHKLRPAFFVNSLQRRLPLTVAAVIAGDGLGLDHHIERAGVIAEVAFVDAEKQHTVARRGELAVRAD